MCKHFAYFPIIHNPYHDATTAVMIYGLRESAMDGNNLDGTGIGYTTGEQFVINKTGDNALLHTRRKAFYNLMSTIDFNVQPIIGHVRKASISMAFNRTAKEKEKKYPDKDAHPFVAGNVMLTHNGTITNHDELIKDAGISKEYIDSQVIAELMAKQDIFDVASLNAVTSLCRGTFALLMQHVHYPDKIIVGRHGRPLFIGVVESRHDDTDVLSFGIITTDKDVTSKALIASNLASRIFTGISPWSSWDFITLDEDVWYMIDRPKFVEEHKPKVMGKLEYKKIAVPVHTTITPYQSAARIWYDGKEELQKATSMADNIRKLLDVLPISVEEFRTIYSLLTRSEYNCEFDEHQVTMIIGYLQHILKDPSSYQYLGEFLGASITPLKDGTFYLEYKATTKGV